MLSQEQAELGHECAQGLRYNEDFRFGGVKLKKMYCHLVLNRISAIMQRR